MREGVVALIMDKKGNVLIGKKIVSSSYLSNKWHLPGGGKFEGETDEESIIREMKEETNLYVTPNKFLGTFIDREHNHHSNYYLCFIDNSKEVKPGSDLTEIKLVKPNEVFSYCDYAKGFWPKEVLSFIESLISSL